METQVKSSTIMGCPMLVPSEMDLSPYCENGRFKSIRGRLFRSSYLNRGKFPVTFVRDVEERLLLIFIGTDAIDPIGGLDLRSYLRETDPVCNGLWTKVEHAVLDFMGSKKKRKSKKRPLQIGENGQLEFIQPASSSKRRVRRSPLCVVINDTGPEV